MVYTSVYLPGAFANRLVQLHRSIFRLTRKLGGQHAPTVLVLRQRGCTLATADEGAHQLSVGLFAPWLQRDLAPGIYSGLLVRAALFGMGRQVCQCPKDFLVQAFAQDPRPILKGLAAFNSKILKKIAAIQLGRPLKTLDTGAASGGMAMRMVVACI